mgnify:CR=1 FL=1
MKHLALRALAILFIAVSAPGVAAAPSGGLPQPLHPAADAAGRRLLARAWPGGRAGKRQLAEVLETAPNNPEANYYMGLAKIGLDKTKASIRFFEKAIAARADFTEARERLALAQIELGDRAPAQAQLDALKKQAAHCETAACGAAYADRLGQAIARIEAALAGDGTSAESAALFLAPAGSGGGRYRGAVRLVNEARYKEAIAELYAAQADIGPHPDILNYLGYAHRKLGQLDAARDYYAQALAIDPGHLGANEYLGELYVETGDVELARRQLARLDALCPFGCAEREDLARLLAIRESPRSAAR